MGGWVDGEAGVALWGGVDSEAGVAYGGGVVDGGVGSGRW